MKGFSAINVSYSNSDDLVSINEPIVAVAKHVRQSGGDSFARVKYMIEPYESNHHIVVENIATIEPRYNRSDEMNTKFQKFCEAVIYGIQSSADYFFKEHHKRIGRIKITLLELFMHPTDSNEFAYKIVGIKIIHNNFRLKVDILNIKRKLIQSHIQFNPPISRKTIFNFEKTNDITLPEELVAFYTEIANGCETTDSCDFLRFEELKFDNLEQIKREFKFTERWIWEAEGSNEISKNLYTGVCNGNIVLVDLGCGQTWNIIISGQERGQMWLFSDLGIAPCSPKRNFLSWFEDWIHADGDVSCYFSEPK